MIDKLEIIEVGTRVAYEDAANPRREGRVIKIYDDGLQFGIEWDEESRDDGGSTVFAGDTLVAETRRVELGTVSDLRQHGWTILADMPELDTTTLRVESILMHGAAEAYGVNLYATEAPCSLCGCASPAQEPAECDRPNCPVEGAGRDEKEESW